MDRSIAVGELRHRKSSIRYEIAGPQHDAGIRRLLRETPMKGKISLSLEREPNSFLAASIEGPEHQTIVGLDGEQIICTGNISARQRFINGQPMRVGYLGGLRLDASRKGQASIIRRGYDFYHKLHREQSGPPIYLTSIVSDNLPARRLLERGLPGMPTYRFLGEFVTLVIGYSRKTLETKYSEIRQRFTEAKCTLTIGAKQHADMLLQYINEDHAKYQFAQVNEPSDITALGLRIQDFRIACSSEGIPIAFAALWNQQSFKQSIVRNYTAIIACLRFLRHFASYVPPRLPAIGEAIPMAYVAHIASAIENPEYLEWLVILLQRVALFRDIDYLIIGFDARDPRLTHLRKVFKPREYHSRLYAVHWEDGAALANSLDDRLLLPEVALL